MSKVKMSALLPLLYALSAAIPAAAAPPVEGQKIVLVLPANAFKTKAKTMMGMATGVSEYAATVEGGAAGVAANGDSEWKTSGFPLLRPYVVKKVKTDAIQTVVELRPDPSKRSDRSVRLTLTGNRDAAWAAVAVAPGSADDARRSAYDAIGAKFFTGPLAALSPEKKTMLLDFANVTAHGTTVGSADFKGHTYMVVDLGDSDVFQLQLASRAGALPRLPAPHEHHRGGLCRGGSTSPARS